MTSATPWCTRLARAVDLRGAAQVWRKANIARGKVPDQERIGRVNTKLVDPAALVVVTVDHDELVVGMLLAEPGRELDGAGGIDPSLCHVSMVFVHPDLWGRRIGHDLLDAAARYALRCGHSRLQLWTGAGNHRALCLYQRAGFHRTGRSKQLHTGELVVHLSRSIC